MASLLRSVLITAPLQLIFRAGEALFPFLLASWFGRSAETDLNVLVGKGFVLAGALITAVFQDSVFIPSLTEKQDGGDVGGFAGAVQKRALGLASLSAIVFGFGYALWLRREPQAFPIIAVYALHMVLVTRRAFLVGYMHAHRDFVSYPVASGAGMALTLGAVYTLRAKLGVVAIPLGLACGELLAGVLLSLRMRALPEIHTRSDQAAALRTFSRLASLEALGNFVTRVNPLVDQVVARQSAIVGGGTLLGYAFDVASVPTTLAQAAFFSIFLTHLSAAAKDAITFRKLLHTALFWIPTAIAALSLVLYLVRVPLLNLLFLHQAMDKGGVDTIAAILPYALVGAAPFGGLLLLARAHVALQNTRIMLRMGALNAALNAGLNFAFFPLLGLSGIALSTSVMHALIAVVFFWQLRKLPIFHAAHHVD